MVTFFFSPPITGPDIYCDDKWLCDPACSSTKDGTLNSINGFGRLEIEAYPYCLKVYWDGAGHDHCELPSWNHHTPRIAELVQMNLRPEIQRQRNVRQWIRGAADSNQNLYLPNKWTEQKTRQVDDGTDSEGNRKTKAETYYIDWDYTRGKVSVVGDFGESKFEQGFNVNMTYTDGVGRERGGSKAGTMHHNGHRTFGHASMGINHSNYQMTPNLSTLLMTGDNGQNRVKVQNGLIKYQNDAALFRKKQAAIRYWDNYALSWSFWYLIYNNDLMSMDMMTLHFQYIEQNPAVKKIPVVYMKELRALTGIIARFNCNPCVGYWYLYWHDLWLNNKDLKTIKKNEAAFNPGSPESIAFKPMGRQQTEEYLKKLGKNVLGIKQTEHLNRFFAQIDVIAKTYPTRIVVQGQLLNDRNSKYVVPLNDDGNSLFVGFASNTVKTGANPTNVAIIDPAVGHPGVWVRPMQSI